MKVISKIKAFLLRMYCTMRAIVKLWKDGGITYANITPIEYGDILKGKSVLVTGGGSGIGLAIARKCLSLGARVVITGRNEEKLILSAEAVGHSDLHTLAWDIADSTLLEDKIQQVLELLDGRLDILVNNAGVLLGQPFFNTDVDVWDQTYSVNSKGPFFISQAFSRVWMQKKQEGKIINIASTAGFIGATDSYRMSKWDLVGLTRGLGQLLSPYGIIVNGIAPGRTATEMLGRSEFGNLHDTHQPLARMGTTVEIAEIAAFLMSDAANYIVGQTIVCDGGYTLKA